MPLFDPVDEGVGGAVPDTDGVLEGVLDKEGDAVGVGGMGTPTIMTLSLRRLPPPPAAAPVMRQQKEGLFSASTGHTALA